MACCFKKETQCETKDVQSFETRAKHVVSGIATQHISVSPICVCLLDFVAQIMYIYSTKGEILTSLRFSQSSTLKQLAPFSSLNWKLVSSQTHLFLVGLRDIYWSSSATPYLEEHFHLQSYMEVKGNESFFVDCNVNGILAYCLPSQEKLYILRLGAKHKGLHHCKTIQNSTFIHVIHLAAGLQYVLLRTETTFMLVSYQGEVICTSNLLGNPLLLGHLDGSPFINVTRSEQGHKSSDMSEFMIYCSRGEKDRDHPDFFFQKFA